MNIRLLLKGNGIKKGNNTNGMINLGFFYGDNDILQGSGGGHNLNPMNIPAMLVEGCCILISPATYGTSNGYL